MTLTTQSKSHYYAETLTPDDLIVDERVQRKEGVSETRVTKMVQHFNPDALGVLTISEREGGIYAVIDGAHRVTTCRRVGHTSPLPTKIHRGLTLQDEATLFRLLNDFKAPTAVSRFLVRVVEGEPVATDISAILVAHGLEVTLQPRATGTVSAVAACERVYTSGAGVLKPGHYPNVFDPTIYVLTEAWRDRSGSTHGNLIEGVGQIIARIPGIDTARLIDKMKDMEPATAMHMGSGLQKSQGGKISAAIAKVLIGQYNRGLKSDARRITWNWTR